VKAGGGLLAALSLCLVTHTAHAEVCPVPEGADPLAKVDARERLDYLARAFDREVTETDRWSWAWTSIYVGGVAAEGALLATAHDPGKRIDDTVGLGSTAFGAVALFALPLTLTLPLRAARAHWNDPDRCKTLANAEETLLKVEKDQEFAHGVLGHIGNAAVNVGFGLLLGLGYGRWSSAALNTSIGIVVGEVNAFTQPRNLRDVLERYRSGRFDLTSPRMTWAVVPMVSPQMSGAALRLSW
jgi:hypothetical protein